MALLGEARLRFAKITADITSEVNSGVTLSRTGATFDFDFGPTIAALRSGDPLLIAEVITDDPTVLKTIDIAQEIKEGGITSDVIFDVIGQDGLVYDSLPPGIQKDIAYVEAALNSDAATASSLVLDPNGGDEYIDRIKAAMVTAAEKNPKAATLIVGALLGAAAYQVIKEDGSKLLSDERNLEIRIEVTGAALKRYPNQVLRQRANRNRRLRQEGNAVEPLQEWEQMIAVMADPLSIRLIDQPTQRTVSLASAARNSRTLRRIVEESGLEGKQRDEVLSFADEIEDRNRKIGAGYTGLDAMNSGI